MRAQVNQRRVEFSHSTLIADFRNYKPIGFHESEISDQVKRAYVLSGPTQPRGFQFPRKWIGGEW
jgi:hypothetical protein